MREWTLRLYGRGGIMSATASTLTMPSPASLGAGFGSLDLLTFRLAVFFAGFAFLVFFAFAFAFFAFFAIWFSPPGCELRAKAYQRLYAVFNMRHEGAPFARVH